MAKTSSGRSWERLAAIFMVRGLNGKTRRLEAPGGETSKRNDSHDFFFLMGGSKATKNPRKRTSLKRQEENPVPHRSSGACVFCMTSF